MLHTERSYKLARRINHLASCIHDFWVTIGQNRPSQTRKRWLRKLRNEYADLVFDILGKSAKLLRDTKHEAWLERRYEELIVFGYVLDEMRFLYDCYDKAKHERMIEILDCNSDL